MSEPTKQFTVEQPSRLNHLVDKTIPLSWHVRWCIMKPLLPLLVFSSICFVEIIFIRAWLADELGDSRGRLILGLLFPPLLVLIVGELQLRLRHRQKRRLSVKKRGLRFSPGDNFCPWKGFAGLRFEPIVGHAHLKRCVLLGIDSRKQVVTSSKCALVLDAPQQRDLIQAVPLYRPSGLGDFRIDEPEAAESPAHRNAPFFKGITIYVLGFYLLLHGAPLVFVSVRDSNTRQPEQTSDFVVAERRSKQVAEFVEGHFQSTRQFRACVFWTGITLAVLGLGGMVAAGILLRRAK